MALTPDIVTSAALRILADFGLGDLTMRRLARELEVQPSALYWHVADKQSLFVLLAQRIAQEADMFSEGCDPIDGILRYRRVLLRYRESADIVLLAFAHSGPAVLPASLTSLPAPACDLVPRYVLGSIAVQQSRSLFGTLPDAEGGPDDAAEASFRTGIERLLAPDLPESEVRGEDGASQPPAPAPPRP
ncbi:TetR family transcriptional regulator [Brevibacterium senegalense]|uniref:TetR family transcriptional regulator n=1 Tax=Brevibacterium senegalense TaxID=1033736 RepID=UPI00037861BD|nr:TetR family transcriptional regulator [Brevibacterium senegalense]